LLIPALLSKTRIANSQECVTTGYGEVLLKKDADALEAYFRHHWRRNQISDHFPIWFILATDSSMPFLEGKKAKLGG